MKTYNAHDLARGCPPSSVAAVSPSLSATAPSKLVWDKPGYKWNGFDSWSAKIDDYLKSGFVQPLSKSGLAEVLPYFQTFGQNQKETLRQYDDGEMLVTAGQFYAVVDLAAAFRRLREETAFTVPDCMLVVDPRAPGKGFLAMEKIDFTDGRSLEYQLLGEGSDDCMKLVGEIMELLALAKEVLQGEFWVALDNPCNWGLTKEGIKRARARLPLTESDMIILRPIH